MTLRNRLRRLEQKVPDPGCLGCRERRGRMVMVDCQAQRDGSVLPLDVLPVACAACGLAPEFVMEMIQPFSEGGDEDDDRVAD